MTAPADLLPEIESLIERGQGLRFHVPQDTGFISLDPKHIGGVLEVLEKTVEALRHITNVFDDGPGLAPSASGLTAQDVADLAFVGRTETVEMRDNLAQARANGNVWKVAAEGDRAVARATRTLISVEAALRELSGLALLERKYFDLNDALEIRSHYAKLWLAVVWAGEPQKLKDVERNLRGIGDLIAELRREKIYPFLRIDDRLEIRNLQKRIMAFFEAPGAEAEQAGRRLWQDLVGFLHLLMHVNRREELREHDRLLVGRVYREINDHGSRPGELSAEMHESLRGLASLDPDLDRLLVLIRPGRLSDYREPLQRLREKLLQE
jgi:hypothetical protein